MYEFIRGPLVIAAFILFVGGGLYRLVSMYREAKREKTVLPTFDARYGLRSLLHWIVPFASRSTRIHPLLTIVSYAFHACLLLTPLLAMGHAVLWHESFGVSWWSLPPLVADVMTFVVIVACAFFLARRIVLRQVRNVTTASDVVLLVIVVLPFATGFAAHQQWFDYEYTLYLHIISGALWLMIIPFTRIAHMMWFAFTRSYMGSEFGAIRNARDW